MNGRVLADDVWKEHLGAWFRRDHPGRAFPSWLAGELCLFSEQDPGYERDWNNVTVSMAQGKLDIDVATRDWVSFVFHLQPFQEAPLGAPPDDGWFAPEEGLRRPVRFPLGIAAQVRDPIHRQALVDIVGEDEPHDDDGGYEIIDDDGDD
jgi:hypothetical protein